MEALFSLMLFLLLLVYLIVIVFPLKAGPRTIETLEQSMNHLLQYGQAGAALYIRFSYMFRGLELRKYVNSPEDYGIILCFPKKRWTKPHFEAIGKLCEQQNCEYGVRDLTIGRRQAKEYLFVIFQRDVSVAYRFIRTILLDILGVDKNRRYIVYFEGISH